jgi:hypothetical protein
MCQIIGLPGIDICFRNKMTRISRYPRENNLILSLHFFSKIKTYLRLQNLIKSICQHKFPTVGHDHVNFVKMSIYWSNKYASN